METRGDPATLTAFGDEMVPQVRRARHVADDYRQAMLRLHARPSDLTVPAPDRSARIVDVLERLEQADRQPSLFAAALQLADRLGAPGGRAGARLLRLADPRMVDRDLLARRVIAARLAGSLRDDLERALRSGELPPELAARVERLLGVPEVAVAFVRQSGPEELLDLPVRLITSHELLLRTQSLTTPVDAPGHLDAVERVVDALAAALALASHDGLGEDHATRLVEVAADRHGAAAGLSLLLARGGHFERDYLRRIADQVHATERAGSSPFWRPLAEAPDGGLPVLFGSDAWYDPMVGVALALAEHPLEAQRFLLEDDGRGGDRLGYLTAQRVWRADEGAAFGALIEAASTVHRDLDGEGSPGYRSAVIASRFLDELPYHPGGGWGPRRGRDPGFSIYEQLIPTVARVLAVYLLDVREVGRVSGMVGNAGSVWDQGYHGVGEQAQAYGIVLDGARAPQLLRAVAEDPEAYAQLITANHVLARQELAVVAARRSGAVGHEELEAAFARVLERQATAAGMLLHAESLAAIDEAAARDARAAALMRAVDLGAVAAGTKAGPLTAEVVAAAVPSVTGRLAPSSHETRAWLDAKSAEMLEVAVLRHLALEALVAHGWFDQDGPYADVRPDASLVDDGGVLRAPASLDDPRPYDHWWRGESNPASGWRIEQAVTEGIDRFVPR